MAVLTADEFSAIQELTDLIGHHPHAYLAVEKSYGVPAATNLNAAVAQAMVLAKQHADFETRLNAQMSHVRNFHFGKGFRIFAAIFTGGASLIAEGIAKAVQKHKAAVAAQAQANAAAQGATPAAAAQAGQDAANSDPVAHAKANPQNAQPTKPGFWDWLTGLFKAKPVPPPGTTVKKFEGDPFHPDFGGKGQYKRADGAEPHHGHHLLKYAAPVLIALAFVGLLWYLSTREAK